MESVNDALQHYRYRNIKKNLHSFLSLNLVFLVNPSRSQSQKLRKRIAKIPIKKFSKHFMASLY